MKDERYSLFASRSSQTRGCVIFKQFVIVTVASVVVLSIPVFAGDIFMSRLKATAVDSFNPDEPIDSFTTYTSGGWECLTAHSGSSSGDIFKDSLDGDGIVIKKFTPGAPIDSFTASGPAATGPDSGCVFLIAHAGSQLDTIIKTKWKGTWIQGCSESGKVVKGFTVRHNSSKTEYDTVWLDALMEVPIPTAPTNFTMSALDSVKIECFWTDNSDNEDGFFVANESDSGTSWADTVDSCSGTGTTLYDTIVGRDENTQYR